MANVSREKRRVVIIDDSRIVPANLEDAFKVRHDFIIVGVANTADVGAEMILRLKPDIVTIDLCMPYIDGVGVLTAMGQPPGTCAIIVSNHLADNMAMFARLAMLGAAACLTKRELSENPGAFFDKINVAFDVFQLACQRRDKPVSTERSAVEPARMFAQLPYAKLGYPVPMDEKRRLEILNGAGLANSVRERQFDLVTKHLALATGFPICLLTVIDKGTQWIKSAEGLDVASTPREHAFCNYTISQDGAFVIADAAADTRFAANPLVTREPHIGSYAGCSITATDGTRIAALCLIDVKPRKVSDGALRQLASMAEIVSEMIRNRPLLAA